MFRILFTLCAILSALILTAEQEESARARAVGTPVAVVVHKSCSTENVSMADLRKMLTGEVRAWPDTRRIVLIEQPDNSPVQRRMLRLLFRTDPAGYKKQLLSEQFQGKELPLIKILNADENAIKFVWNLPGAIALVDANSAMANTARVKVLRVDGKAPGEPGYLLQ